MPKVRSWQEKINAQPKVDEQILSKSQTEQVHTQEAARDRLYIAGIVLLRPP